MKTSKRNKIVEVWRDIGEQDSLYNPVLTRIGQFYADVAVQVPREAIATGQMAEVEFLQITFLASDARRLGINGLMKIKYGEMYYEINTPPYQHDATDNSAVRLNVSRKLEMQ